MHVILFIRACTMRYMTIQFPLTPSDSADEQNDKRTFTNFTNNILHKMYPDDNLNDRFCTSYKDGQIFNKIILQNAQKINIYFQHIIHFD